MKKDVKTEYHLRKSQNQLIVGMFGLLFVVMLVFTTLWVTKYNRDIADFARAEATIVDHAVDDYVYDIIEFEVKNVIYRKTTPYISRNSVNDKIVVYYDTKNPTTVIYGLDARRIWLPIITVVFGMAFVGLIVLHFVTYPKGALHSTMQTKKKPRRKAKK